MAAARAAEAPPSKADATLLAEAAHLPELRAEYALVMQQRFLAGQDVRCDLASRAFGRAWGAGC